MLSPIVRRGIYRPWRRNYRWYPRIYRRPPITEYIYPEYAYPPMEESAPPPKSIPAWAWVALGAIGLIALRAISRKE